MPTPATTAAPAEPAAPPARRRPGNISGRARALTLHTPIRPAWTPFLRLVMRTSSLHPLFKRHSLQFNFIYFVRWAIVDRMPPDRSLPAEDLHHSYLFFESNFDTPWKQYIDAFAYIIPRDIRTIWGRGPAFPGPPPAEPLKAWIARNSLEGGHYYAAYPEASVKMVLSALHLRRRFGRLVRDAQGAGPERFERLWTEFLDDVQHDL